MVLEHRLLLAQLSVPCELSAFWVIYIYILLPIVINGAWTLQGVHRGIWWYYMISLAFYWSLTFSQFFDVKRKDFWQMFVHHIATILLLSFSWICNLHRAGSVVLVIHDAADCIVDVSIIIMLNYKKKRIWKIWCWRSFTERLPGNDRARFLLLRFIKRLQQTFVIHSLKCIYTRVSTQLHAETVK
jgi:hypothetical protein